MNTILALRRGEKTPKGRPKLVPLCGIALVLLLSFSLAGCGKNVTGGPKYTAAQIARDVLVGEKAFLKTAIENHGGNCRSGCTLPLVNGASLGAFFDQKLCVGTCNAIKLADEARKILEAALDAHCAGPGFLEGKAPCGAGAANDAELVTRTREFREAVAGLRTAEGRN